MYLSIIIPAYSEETRLKLILEKVHSYLSNKTYTYEIVVIDDGSSDKTAEVALESELNKTKKLILLKNERNSGKGFSVKKGILASKGDYALFSDADLSTPIEELDKLFDHLKKGFDVAIGSRSISSSDVRTRQPWYREKMGRIFNFFVKILFSTDFNDTQCGFKLFKGNIAREIAAQLVIDGFSFDVEILYLAKKRGYKITEVGVI